MSDREPEATQPPEATQRPSPLRTALERVGDRWSLLIVDALLGGPRRFGDLSEEVAGIAPNILSRRLKDLEGEGVVVARPYCRRPLRHAYELTVAGQELAGALRLLADWGGRQAGAGEPLRHESCGTALEARWYCATCAAPVNDDEASDVTYV